jgi:hypothetical protein
LESLTSGQEIAFTILREFERARTDLLGKAVVLSKGSQGQMADFHRQIRRVTLDFPVLA